MNPNKLISMFLIHYSKQKRIRMILIMTHRYFLQLQIDDLDFSPCDTSLVSIAKDGQALVWSTASKRTPLLTITCQPANGNKFLFRRCRYLIKIVAVNYDVILYLETIRYCYLHSVVQINTY